MGTPKSKGGDVQWGRRDWGKDKASGEGEPGTRESQNV